MSRGYLNQEALTNERFVTNPFATVQDKEKGYTRLYKTGDLVRWLSDGNLEYIGRNDDQVKLRGYRIELGEIQAAINSIKGIVQSCVLAKERITDTANVKYLVAYYIQEEGSDLSDTNILEHLTGLLPDYMVPSHLIALDSFPLTINGKLDKKALPDPDLSIAIENYIAPSTCLLYTSPSPRD